MTHACLHHIACGGGGDEQHKQLQSGAATAVKGVAKVEPARRARNRLWKLLFGRTVKNLSLALGRRANLAKNLSLSSDPVRS